MFKVKKIEEKIDLEDLKINDDDVCMQEWINVGSFEGDNCRVDCCKDCTKGGYRNPYRVYEY